jgi:hypothetical protein
VEQAINSTVSTANLPLFRRHRRNLQQVGIAASDEIDAWDVQPAQLPIIAQSMLGSGVFLP